jgi:hypothetical protein
VVGRLVRNEEGYRVEDARVVAVGGELKSFTPDRQSVVLARFARAFEAANPDDVLVDLRTGAESRLTYAPDWDEYAEPGPARHPAPSPTAGTPNYQRAIEIRYVGFSDERGFVIDGVERSLYDRPGLYGGRALYNADLTVSGKHTGYLHATNVQLTPLSVRGTIESQLDGRRLTLGPLP